MSEAVNPNRAITEGLAVRIMVIGTFGSVQRDAAIAEGFRRCGCDVVECSYGDVLYATDLPSRVQFRFSFGPVYERIAQRVLERACAERPDVLFFRMPLEFSTEMLEKLRKGYPAIYAAFNNDDPFSTAYRGRRWNRFRNALASYDLVFAFRRSNLASYRTVGVSRTALWEPFFSPWIHRPLLPTDAATKGFSILFAMHAERDERREAILELKRAGHALQVHSWNWAQTFGQADADAFGVLPPIWEDDYVRAVQAASATLCFFSKQNNDELTSRVFEILACRGLLLSWRTPRLAELFTDRDEVFLFSSMVELVEICEELARSPALVARTKERGYARLLASRHSVVDRCRDALAVLQEL